MGNSLLINITKEQQGILIQIINASTIKGEHSELISKLKETIKVEVFRNEEGVRETV